MVDELLLVRVDDLLAAEGALGSVSGSFPASVREMRTIEVGFLAFTGSPFALTGALVPAASAFL